MSMCPWDATDTVLERARLWAWAWACTRPERAARSCDVGVKEMPSRSVLPRVQSRILTHASNPGYTCISLMFAVILFARWADTLTLYSANAHFVGACV